MKPIHVLKFGGTSLQDASFIQQAAGIVGRKAASARPVVVVSAVAGVTDQLAYLADHISPNSVEAAALTDQLKLQHITILDQLTANEKPVCCDRLKGTFDSLHEVHSTAKAQTGNLKAWRDEVLSFGERASAQLMSAALSRQNIANRCLNAGEFIKTDENFGEANVLPGLTKERIKYQLSPLKEVPVITGFIGSTNSNKITTLGRSGSDYTASLIADAMEADHLEIWTDVDGVLTAHPDLVPAAKTIEQLNFEDVTELAENGVGVIHPKTIEPIRNRDISLHVRNSYNRDHPGTKITRSFTSNGGFKSVTIAGPFVYFEIENKYAPALNLILEEQKAAASDTEIFSYSRSSGYEPSWFLIRQPFFHKIKSKIQQWGEQARVIKYDIYKVKKFTNKLKQNDESLKQLIEILRQRRIKPLRIGREYNQRHIHTLLPQEQAYEAARAINDHWIDGRKTVSLFIAGTGAVGGTLIDQIDDLKSSDLNLKIIGTCNSKQVQWIDTDRKQPTDWPVILQELNDTKYTNVVFVDATGSKEVARLYPQLFEAGIHVATPSKLANTFEQSFYNRIHQIAFQKDVHFHYETTVGAGLPVISTLHDLLESGDTVTQISGVVSGTMTYLFEQMEKGLPFSEAIVKARELGYAEPDPRDDLSGEDVARKFLTLARTVGYKVEREQLQVESLVPRDLLNTDHSTFLSSLSDYNEHWKKRFEAARKRGETLRYTGTLKEGKISIEIESVPINSPLGLLKETDNLIQIYSRNYKKKPLIIQGPGAGKNVTAAGVLSDIVKIGKSL